MAELSRPSLHETTADDQRVRLAVAAYVAELAQRFPVGFDPGPADVEGTYLLAVSTAEADAGATAACGGVRTLEPGVAEIKRMWVADPWRGAGLGRWLLGELEALAARQGHHTVRLDTNGTLVEAIALYDRAGYRRIERYNDNPYAEAWFEKRIGTSLNQGPAPA